MKILKVNLNGQERTLDVGKFYFTKFLGEALGGDPLTPDNNQFKWVTAIVYAGMQTNCRVNKIEQDFTLQDVEGWIGCLELDEVADIINRYAALGEKPGE